MYEEQAVGHLKGTVANAEGIRAKLVQRLNANARLDAPREQSMHQVADDLRRAVSGFRASEMESESEQRRIFLGRAQELAGMEQRIVEQVAAQSEHGINEEYAAICQQQRVQTPESSQELDMLVRNKVEFCECCWLDARFCAQTFFCERDFVKAMAGAAVHLGLRALPVLWWLVDRWAHPAWW